MVTEDRVVSEFAATGRVAETSSEVVQPGDGLKAYAVIRIFLSDGSRNDVISRLHVDHF